MSGIDFPALRRGRNRGSPSAIRWLRRQTPLIRSPRRNRSSRRGESPVFVRDLRGNADDYAAVQERQDGLDDAPFDALERFRQCLLSNLPKPKVLIFYFSFLPQFAGSATSAFEQLEFAAPLIYLLADRARSPKPAPVYSHVR